MKRVGLLLLSAVTATAISYALFNQVSKPFSSQPDTKPLAQHADRAVKDQETRPATQNKPLSIPTRLKISKIGVDAAIESAGLNKSREMDTPKDPAQVAWYKLGYKPGQNGSAVIAGHLDSAQNGPAVFWNLKKLTAGDEVTVIYDSGQTYVFKVSTLNSYSADKFPLQQVFATAGKPTLQLISCAGQFQGSAGYNQRLVVSADLDISKSKL